MADTLSTPSRWRRFRQRQAWLAVPFLLLAIAGLLAAIGGVLPGLVLLLLFSPVGLLCVLNARAGRRGGHSVRLVARDGATQLEFPSHGLGTALVLLLVAVSLSTLVVLLLVYSWDGIHGSIAAGAAAVFFVVATGYWVYGVHGLWAGGRSGAHQVGRLSGSAPRESSWSTRSKAGSCPGICIRCQCPCLTRISTQEVEGNLSAVNASGIVRLTCGNRNRGSHARRGISLRGQDIAAVIWL